MTAGVPCASADWGGEGRGPGVDRRACGCPPRSGGCNGRSTEGPLWGTLNVAFRLRLGVALLGMLKLSD